MLLSDIDPNFRLDEKIPGDTVFRDVWEEPFRIWGLAPNGKGVFSRLPLSMLPSCSEGVQRLSACLAGACVRFSTDAEGLSLVWELTVETNMPHFAASGRSGMELFEETDEGTVQVVNLVPALVDGGRTCLRQSRYVSLRGGLRHYVLYLPLYNGLKTLLLGFPSGARVLPGRVPRIEKPIVYYGSSVTQGGCTNKAGSCYTTLLARRLDAAQINLGFSGNGKGEPELARYIASLDMSLFVLDYDHNAPSPEHLQATHEPFFRIVREAHPDLPVVMISRCDTKNPEATARRRDVIRTTYRHALEAGDRNVRFVDGGTLFGTGDRDMCTVDGTHPTDLGFLRMADGLEPVLRELLKK